MVAVADFLAGVDIDQDCHGMVSWALDRGAFDFHGLCLWRARFTVPVSIKQSLDREDHTPRHEAACDRERDHAQDDIAPSEVFEHVRPRRNPEPITLNRRLGSNAG